LVVELAGVPVGVGVGAPVVVGGGVVVSLNIHVYPLLPPPSGPPTTTSCPDPEIETLVPTAFPEPELEGQFFLNHCLQLKARIVQYIPRTELC